MPDTDATQLLSVAKCKAIREGIALSGLGPDDPMVCAASMFKPGSKPKRMDPASVKRVSARMRVLAESPDQLVQAIGTIEGMHRVLGLLVTAMSYGQPDPKHEDRLTGIEWERLTVLGYDMIVQLEMPDTDAE